MTDEDPIREWVRTLPDHFRDEARFYIGRALVRSRREENEACAKVADEYALGTEFSLEDRLHDNATNIAAAIRARVK